MLVIVGFGVVGLGCGFWYLLFVAWLWIGFDCATLLVWVCLMVCYACYLVFVADWWVGLLAVDCFVSCGLVLLLIGG